MWLGLSEYAEYIIKIKENSSRYGLRRRRRDIRNMDTQNMWSFKCSELKMIKYLDKCENLKPKCVLCLYESENKKCSYCHQITTPKT